MIVLFDFMNKVALSPRRDQEFAMTAICQGAATRGMNKMTKESPAFKQRARKPEGEVNKGERGTRRLDATKQYYEFKFFFLFCLVAFFRINHLYSHVPPNGGGPPPRRARAVATAMMPGSRRHPALGRPRPRPPHLPPW